MTDHVFAHTDRLVLRRFRGNDLDAFLRYRNDPLVQRYDGLHGITVDRAREFIAEQAIHPVGEPGEWFQIAIELVGQGLIGDCGFRVDDDVAGTAEIGYRLDTAQWGQGFGSEAVGGVLDWAFTTLDVHRVIAVIDTRNEHSIGLVERLSFRREGHFIESYLEPGGPSDEYLYAMLKREWGGYRCTPRAESISNGRHNARTRSSR